MRRWGAVPVLALAVALAGCGGSDPKSDATPTGTPSPSRTPIPQGYPSDAPYGPAYTEAGTDLVLGEAATVAWQPPLPGAPAGSPSGSPASSLAGTATEAPSGSASASTPATQSPSGTASPSGPASPSTPATPTRQSVALQIAVTAIQPTTYAKSFRDWKVSDALKSSSPYFVKAKLTNVGTVGLGSLKGLPIPLYGETSADTLVEASTFVSTFKPCSPSEFPKKLRPRASVEVCLVYLVPDRGTLAGVAFRPDVDFVPIRWATPAAMLPSPSVTGSPTGSPGTIGVTPTPSGTMTP